MSRKVNRQHPEILTQVLNLWSPHCPIQSGAMQEHQRWGCRVTFGLYQFIVNSIRPNVEGEGLADHKTWPEVPPEVQKSTGRKENAYRLVSLEFRVRPGRAWHVVLFILFFTWQRMSGT